MILVILQHTYLVMDHAAVNPTLNFGIYWFTRTASVAFMFVSGMMIAYFLATRPNWKDVQKRFARRALFLLLFAHTAILLVTYYYIPANRFNAFVQGLYLEYAITDTIALSLLLAPPLIHYLSLKRRAVLIAVMLLVTPLFAALPLSASSVLEIGRIAIFGEPIDFHRLSIGWPLVPWLAIFLCGSMMGQALAATRSGELPTAVLVSKMRRLAAGLAGLGIVLSAAFKLFKPYLLANLDARAVEAISPSRTTSFLPIYLAALLLLFSYLVDRIDVRHRYNRGYWFLSVFGRTSLFTFVTHFAYVNTIPALLGLRNEINLWQCALLFVAGTIASWITSYTYGRMRGWITRNDYVRICGELVPPETRPETGEALVHQA